MSDVKLNSQKDLMKHQMEIAYGVEVITRIVDTMLSNRASDECPEWMKSDFIAGGLIAAISELSRLAHDHTRKVAELQGLDIED